MCRRKERFYVPNVQINLLAETHYIVRMLTETGRRVIIHSNTIKIRLQLTISQRYKLWEC